MCVLRFLLVSFIVCVSITWTNAVVDDYRTVDTNCGKIRGVRKTTLLKKVDYYSFKGVPYAEPPIGELRFKAPEPKKTWSPKIHDAFEFGKVCYSEIGIPFGDYPQSENCLFLNLHVPAHAKPNSKLPVIFFMHGGAFMGGNGNDFVAGPDFLIEQDVIFVSINYRLGVFGFLSLDTPEYSGNMGLKDQQLGLKWVYENIEQFHGDNKRITCIGSSAGAVSSHFHVYSNESRKFIHNSILLSGTAENIWSFGNEKDMISWAYQFAADLGKPQNSVDELVNFLKTVPAESMKAHPEKLSTFYRTLSFPFGPVIERSDAKKPFMVKSPQKILETSNIDTDIIFYISSIEMLGFFTMLHQFKQYDVYDLDTNFTFKLPFQYFNFSFESDQYREIANEVRKFYFGDAVIDKQMMMEYIHLLSDINFVYPNYKAMKIHQKESKGRAFYVRFNGDTKLNVFKGYLVNFFPNITNIRGASHCDEICYAFRCDSLQSYYDEMLQNIDSEQSKIQLQLIESATKLISNFAKYGNPTHNNEPIGNFDPIDGNKITMLDITNDGLQIKQDPRKNANEFWEKMEEKAKRFTQDS